MFLASLAMAHHQAGHKDEARSWLEKARTWQAEQGDKNARGARLEDLPWQNRLSLELTLREAEDLLKAP